MSEIDLARIRENLRAGGAVLAGEHALAVLDAARDDWRRTVLGGKDDGTQDTRSLWMVITAEMLAKPNRRWFPEGTWHREEITEDAFNLSDCRVVEYVPALLLAKLREERTRLVNIEMWARKYLEVDDDGPRPSGACGYRELSTWFEEKHRVATALRAALEEP